MSRALDILGVRFSSNTQSIRSSLKSLGWCFVVGHVAVVDDTSLRCITLNKLQTMERIARRQSSTVGPKLRLRQLTKVKGVPRCIHSPNTVNAYDLPLLLSIWLKLVVVEQVPD